MEKASQAPLLHNEMEDPAQVVGVPEGENGYLWKENVKAAATIAKKEN